MRDVSVLSVAAVRRLIGDADGLRLVELCDAYESDARPGVRAAVDAGRARHRAGLKEAGRLEALYQLEDELRRQDYVAIAGLDEVGRGALAGPLTVGACILPPSPQIVGLDDSKRLSPPKRQEVADRVREVAIAYAVVHVPASDVDSVGLASALKRAMIEAVERLGAPVDHVLVDGNPVSLFAVETAIVGGDRKVAAISAASVVAKVERDALMRAYDADYPEYGFSIHKGYGTREHLQAIAAHGPCPLHRLSFCPGGGTDSLF